MNPIIALIIANIIWGAGAPIFKLALTNVPPFLFVFLRFFIAALLLIPFVLKEQGGFLKIRDYKNLFLAGFFGVTLHISTYFLGLIKTQSINAPIIASASPVFLFFLSVIFLKEKVNFKVLYGMFLSLVGVLVIVFAPIFRKGLIDFGASIEGNTLLIMSTIFFIISALIHKKILNKVRPYTVAFWTFLFGSLPIIPLVINELQTWSITQLNFFGAFGIIYGIFLNTVLAYALYYYGMSKIRAQEVGTFFYIDPVIAILIAIPLLGEFPDKFFAIGTFLVFLGLYLSQGRIPWHPFGHLKKVVKN
ncbi:MAG: DMT family transporter [Patescibacteria group bacterium]